MKIKLTLLALLAMLAGCTHDSGQQNAVQSIVDTRVQVVKAQNDLYGTMKALDGLQNAQGDLKPAYDKFTDALENTEDAAKLAKTRADAMRTNSAAYQKAWEDEISKINDPAIKASAEERIATVRANYDSIRESAQTCRTGYARLNSDLHDIKNYLANDLNAPALAKAQPSIASARADGDALQADLNDLIQKMNIVSMQMNPSGKLMEK